MADVYLLDFRKKKKETYLERLERFLNKARLFDFVKKKDMVGLKVHFGEVGNVNFIRPEYVRIMSYSLESQGTRPFLTDTTTLYGGMRSNAQSHIRVAKDHGFDFSPIIIADGLVGESFLERNGTKIAQVIDKADVIVFISHFKGHLLTGFGGTLKNIGMGCAAKGGKLFLHSNSKPYVDETKCNFCLKCYDYCAFQAIVKKQEQCVIDEKKCSGCCGCMTICPEKAISFHWDSSSAEIQQKIVRYASDIIKEKKAIYFNFLLNITRDCDCFPTKESKITEDIGVLVSHDPVAIDQAAWDLTREALSRVHPDVDVEIQLTEAQRLGMGTMSYQLKEAD